MQLCATLRYVRTITASTSAYWCFKTRLHHLERENTSLTEAKQLAETDHHAQVVQKNSIITQKQEEVDNLTEQLSQLQGQFKQLNQDATTLGTL